MPDMPTVSAALQDKYDTYYHPGQSEWRALGAKDKAGHIVELCRKITPETILDVGAGEGSVLEELSTLGLGKKLLGGGDFRPGSRHD